MTSFIPLAQDSSSSQSVGGIYWAVNLFENSGANTDMFNKGGRYYKYGSVSNWNVNNITNMDGLLQNKSNFNVDIGFWTVSNVKSMDNMFNGATAFDNGGSDFIGNWIVSAVTSMEAMFQNASAFNRNISGWEKAEIVGVVPPAGDSGTPPPIPGGGPSSTLANCKSMVSMFSQAEAFNQDIVHGS